MEDRNNIVLVVPCDRCGLPITNDGGAKVNMGRADRRVRQFSEYSRSQLPNGAPNRLPYIAAPPVIRWRLLHDACDVFPAAPGDHWINGRDLADLSRLVFVIAELASTRWLSHTDSSTLVAFLLDHNGIELTAGRRRAARRRIQDLQLKGRS
jgi:hypothetical protein